MPSAVVLGIDPTFQINRRIVSSTLADSTPWSIVADITTGDRPSLSHIEFHPLNTDHCIISPWPNAATAVYAISTDAGLTWAFPTDGINGDPDIGVRQIVPDPSDALSWWAYCRNFGLSRSQVYKSEDGGTTWTLKHSITYSSPGARSITVSPDGQTIIHMNNEGGVKDYAIWRSTDGGTIWANVYNVDDGNQAQHYIKYARVGSRVLFSTGVFNTRKMYESQDGGATFALLESTDRIGYGNALFVLDNDAFITMFSQLPADAAYSSYSLGNGDTFQNLAAAHPDGALSSTGFWHNPIVPNNLGEMLIAAGTDKFYVSLDRGVSWIEATADSQFPDTSNYPSSMGAMQIAAPPDDRRTFLSLVRQGGKPLL